MFFSYISINKKTELDSILLNSHAEINMEFIHKNFML